MIVARAVSATTPRSLLLPVHALARTQALFLPSGCSCGLDMSSGVCHNAGNADRWRREATSRLPCRSVARQTRVNEHKHSTTLLPRSTIKYRLSR